MSPRYGVPEYLNSQNDNDNSKKQEYTKNPNDETLFD